MCLFAVLWLHHKPDFHVSSVVHHMKWYADHYRDGGIGLPTPLALSPVSYAPAPATSEDLVPPAFAPSSATSQDFQHRQCVATNASVLLYCAMGRHNLGDMLMPHILGWLLKRHCGYTAGQFHHADVLRQNMSRLGGHIFDSTSSSFADGFQTPINVLHCWSEVTSCMLPTAKSFFLATVSVPKGLNEAFGQSPVYLAPNTLFARPLAVIANAIGGSVGADLSNRLQTYDYVSFRNSVGKSLLQTLRDGAIIPDTVVMLKRIFRKEIDAEVASPAVQEIMSSTGGKYMAVHCKTRAITDDIAVQLAETLSVVSAPQFDLSIVFLGAGAAPKHDSIKALRKVGETIKGTPVHYFDELNIWRICALISRASMVVSSSLHVRIVSWSFSRPRATIFTAFKHNALINSWDHGLLPNLSLRGSPRPSAMPSRS